MEKGFVDLNQVENNYLVVGSNTKKETKNLKISKFFFIYIFGYTVYQLSRCKEKCKKCLEAKLNVKDGLRQEIHGNT